MPPVAKGEALSKLINCEFFLNKQKKSNMVRETLLKFHMEPENDAC